MNYTNNNSNHNESNNQHFIPEADYRIENAEPERRESKKQPKKDFFKTMTRTAAYAAIFGLVAGTSFTGFQYVAGTFRTVSESPAEQENTGEQEEQKTLSLTDNSSTNSIIRTSSVNDVSLIAENVMPSIVAIDCEITQTATTFFGREIEQKGEGSGTGIIIKQDKDYLYIASNNHVVADSSNITVTFSDTKTASAVIKGTDASCDLAVIAVKLSDLSSDTKSAIKTATLGDSTTLKVGEMSIAIGNALGYGQSVTVGYVSATGREVEMDNGTMNLIQTDAAINPGNSGGALVNSNGEVIGINSAKYASDEIEGMGFAIPISDAIPILEDLMNRVELDEADQGYLGITGLTVEEEYQEMYNIPEGVHISSVEENSPAQKAGLKEGYIITKINNKSISSTSDILDFMTYTKGGATVEITYQTQIDGVYTEKTVEVVLSRKGDSKSYQEQKEQQNEPQNQEQQNQMDSDNFNNNRPYNNIPDDYKGYFYGNNEDNGYQNGFPDGYMN